MPLIAWYFVGVAIIAAIAFAVGRNYPYTGTKGWREFQEAEEKRKEHLREANDNWIARENDRAKKLVDGITRGIAREGVRLEEAKKRVAAEEQRLENLKTSGEEDVRRFLVLVQERKRERLASIVAKYDADLKSYFEDIEDEKRSANEVLAKIQSAIQDLASKERIAYESLQRTLNNDYPNRLHLSERSIEEMKELYQVCNRLSNALPLYKAIYELYLKVELGDLVRRLGVAGKCGIYRITNIKNGLVYVGQSVSVGDRWKAHVKRGTGSEVGTIAGGKLYAAMLRDGIWNFDFELLEECGRDVLTTNEKFWIDHFNSKESGYNSREG